jgi:hypothetical protein
MFKTRTSLTLNEKKDRDGKVTFEFILENKTKNVNLLNFVGLKCINLYSDIFNRVYEL